MNSESAAEFKRFAMTIQMIEHDLDRIESDYTVDLKRGHRATIEDDAAYYPQIEKDIRAEAARMSPHYEVFYSLEVTIRRLVSDSLGAAEGSEWWSNGTCVPPKIKTDAEGRRQKEIDTGMTPRSTEPLDFTTFGELGEIIKTNWATFGGMFSSIKAMERVMANLNSLRGPIAHCCTLAEDEAVRLRLAVRDWFRLME